MCGTEPQRPAKPYTEKAVSIYLTKLVEWGRHCAGDLHTVKLEIERFNEEVRLFNEEQAKLAKEAE